MPEPAPAGKTHLPPVSRAPEAADKVQTPQSAPAAQKDDDTLKNVALIVSSIFGAVVGIVALFVSIHNTNNQIASSDRNSNAQRWREANQKEIEQLEELLRTFHVPFLVRAEANHNMAQDLRDRLNDPNYRMLLKLFDPNWLEGLSQGDQTIVEEVCRSGLELRAFVEANGGRVDAALADHLARASTHFRMLWLAFDKKLGSDPVPFARYVYPRQLDAALKMDRDRITTRIKTLRSAPSDNHGIIDPLVLPSELQLPAWPNPPRFEPPSAVQPDSHEQV